MEVKNEGEVVVRQSVKILQFQIIATRFFLNKDTKIYSFYKVLAVDISFLLQWSNDSKLGECAMLTAVTAGLPTYFYYFFKATLLFSVMQSAAQIFEISGSCTEKDVQDLCFFVYNFPSPQVRFH